MRRRVLGVLVAVGLTATVAGCRNDEGIGQTASAALAPHVQAVRAAAEQGDRDQALTTLAALRQTVVQLRNVGDLGEQGAASVLEAAADVERQLALLPAPASPPGGGAGRSPATTSPGGRDDDDRDDDADEARKKAEEAAEKAREEAEKAREEAEKRAEDARKRAEEGRKD